jgi:hypothetical protein
MDLVSLVAAVGNGSGALVVGLVLGACIGFLVGPAFRSWQSRREWAEASREVRLADRLLERMEVDAGLEGRTRPSGVHDEALRSPWPTRP